MATSIYENQVYTLFLGYFGRPPAPSGLAYYTSLMDQSGGNWLIIADDFYNSPESQALFGGKSVEAQVNQIFQNLFGRDAAAAGLNYWTGEVLAGRVSLPGLAYTVAYNAQEDDVAVRDAKIETSRLWVESLDTTEEILAFQTDAGRQSARDFLATVTTDTPATQEQVDNAIEDMVQGGGSNPGQTFTLTTGADTIVGMVGSNGTTDNSGDDIIVGTNTTLTAGDNLNGGNGEDVLRVYSDAAKNYAGFELSNIETLQVTADGAQQTFELSGATGLETLVSRNSSQTAVFQQLTTLANLSLDSLTGASNATVQYQDSVVAGAADAVVLTVNNSNAGVVTLGSVGDPNGGIETVNVVATGADTKIATLDTDLTTLNFSGDKNVTITNALNNTTKTIDATGSTGGGLTVGIGAGNANNVTFTGGKGDDQVTFATGTLNVNDQVTGGDGNDRIVADQADLIAARTKISGVEYIRVQSTLINNVADAANVLDASDFADATRFELANGYNTARIDNLNATQQRVDILQGIGGGANVGTLTIDDGATAATNDQFTLALGQDKVNNSVVADVDFVSGTIESVNLISNGDGATAGGAHTLNLLNTLGGNTNVHTLNITGVEGLTVTTAGSKVTTVAAGDATGDLDLTGVVYSATANATITTGSGNDTVTGGVKNDTINVGSGNDVVNASTGADGITLGDGIDRVIYTALNQSNSTGTDTIADFVNKTDIIDISGLGATAYAGTKATFDLAQGALAGGGLVSSVFDASNSRFWVDVDGNGTLDGNDLRVNLAGVTTLDAASVVTAAGVNAVNLTGNVTIATDTGNINVPGFAGGYATVAAAQAAGVQSFVGNNTNQLRLNASAEAAPVAFNMTTGVLTAGTGAQVNNVLYRGVQTADVSSAVADTVTVAAADVTAYNRAVIGSNAAGDIVRVGAGNYGANLALTSVDVVEFSGVGGNFSITTTDGAETNTYRNQTGQALGTVVINAGAETSEAVTVNLLNGIAAAAYTGSAQATFDGGQNINATTGDGIDTIVVNSFDKGGTNGSFVLALNGGTDNVTVAELATGNVDGDDFQINGGNGTDSLSVALTNKTFTADAGDIVSFETVGFTLNGKALSWTTADGDIDAATTITVTDGTGTANVTIDASLEANQKVDINLTATAASAYSLKTGGGSDTVTVTLGDDNGLDVTADIVDLGAGALDTLTVNLNGKALDGALAGKIDGLEVFQTTGTGAIGGTTALTFADDDFSATSVNNVIDISSAQVNAKVDFDGFTAGTVRLADNSGITNTVADGITNVGGDLTIDFGRANATVADVDADAAGNIFTFEFGASTGTQGVLFQATAVDLASGTIFDFANAVTNVGAASTATANEVIITAGANTVILFDANGDGAFSAAGDVQITLTGQNIAAAGFGVDAGGNLYIV